jgi:hypothetical protein
MSLRPFAILAVIAAAAPGIARAETRDDYFNNLEQYQYAAPQPAQRDWRTVKKQVATAPGAAPIQNNRGKDVGYAWVGGKVGSRAFDDPDLVRSNNFAGGLSTEPGGGDPDLLPPDRPGGGVLNLWMQF